MEVYQLLKRPRITPSPLLKRRDVRVCLDPVAEDAEKVHSLKVGGHVAPREREPYLLRARDQELQERRKAAEPRGLHELDRPQVQHNRLSLGMGSGGKGRVKASEGQDSTHSAPASDVQFKLSSHLRSIVSGNSAKTSHQAFSISSSKRHRCCLLLLYHLLCPSCNITEWIGHL